MIYICPITKNMYVKKNIYEIKNMLEKIYV